MLMSFSFATVVFALCAFATPSFADMDIDQTLSDGAQSSTIAFDGFALVTGTLDAQSFFPPGKVADYWGFQYLRDNTPDGYGHDTDFLTNCSFNVLYTLTDDQFASLKALAVAQVDRINLYAYKRYPLMTAFRRRMLGDLPSGSSGLDLFAVKSASADLYALDGQLSFERAVVYASIYKTLTSTQEAYLNSMKTGGFSSWMVTSDMQSFVNTRMKGLTNDVAVALMTYAGDLFAWYTGSTDADVYFCPERQGTYFGSFYVKDAPAVGHPGYKIDEQLTASTGQQFLTELKNNNLDGVVTALVDEQRDSLYAGSVNIVGIRTDISTLLRSLLSVPAPTDALKADVLMNVLAKSRTYGELDGEIVYSYAEAFAQVYQSMTDIQKADMTGLRKKLMSGTYNGVAFDFAVCTTPFLYSSAIVDPSLLTPYISNTDYLFVLAGDVPGAPVGVSAASGNAQATIIFSAPASNGTGPITSYTVTASPGSITATGTGSPIIVSGLTNGTAYTFTVTATNKIGTGPASSPSNSVTPVGLTVPGSPTGVSAFAGNAQATVTFSAPASNGGSAVIKYAVTASPGGITATGIGRSIIVSGLTNGTAYTFTVTATNKIGTGPASSPSNSVTPVGLTVPGSPTGVSAFAGNAQATVTFSAPASNGGSAVIKYTVTASPGNITATGTGRSIIVRALTNGKTYTFTVTATNKVGTGPASSASNSVTPKK